MVLLGLTAVLGYQARGLEGRVLKAIQPHLITDVQVRSVSLTVWDSWPNVEVVLGNVRIEDAIQADVPSVELSALGVVFAWQPLLFGRLEVAEVLAKGGRINVQRYRDGRENWQFWKKNEGEDSGVDWTVESVVLSDVQLDGEWWAEGAEEPVLWSAMCRSAELALKPGVDGAWRVDGNVGLQGAELSASGETWLNVVDLNTPLHLNVVDGVLQVALERAVARNSVGSVEFDAVLGNQGGFSLALLCEEAEGGALVSLVPPGLIDRIEGLPQISGATDVEVLVGSGRLPAGWAGPQDKAWSSGWAVRVVPQSLALRWNGERAELRGGVVSAYPMNKGWGLTLEDIRGAAGGGEFRCSGKWASSDGADHAALQGEMVARPEGVLPWLGDALSMPQGWEIKKGGVMRAQFDLEGDRPNRQPWTWSRGKVHVDASDLGLSFGSIANGDALVLDVAEAEANASPEGWELSLKAFEAVGTNGDVVIRQNFDEGSIEVEASVAECDVTDLLNAFAQVRPKEGKGVENLPLISWSVQVDQLSWGVLSARSIGAQGTYNAERKKGVLSAVKALAFDGNVEAHGAWDFKALQLQGTVVDVELSSFLEGTQGLGQSTLLPSHVRGRAWAEGKLEHHFGKASNLAWETEMDVRIEQGELLDFELLQRIPETLKAEGKYRFISDAEDLSKRLRKVRFEPLQARVTLSRGVFTLDPTEVISDAMDVGIAGWQRLSGGLDYTLDFALRDLKSDQEEFGTTADDGLGHRFFLAIGGTLDAPEFGYDRSAHKLHRQDERRSALGRLRGLILGEENTVNDGLGSKVESVRQDSVSVDQAPKSPQSVEFDDDDDDYSP